DEADAGAARARAGTAHALERDVAGAAHAPARALRALPAAAGRSAAAHARGVPPLRQPAARRARAPAQRVRADDAGAARGVPRRRGCAEPREPGPPVLRVDPGGRAAHDARGAALADPGAAPRVPPGLARAAGGA